MALTGSYLEQMIYSTFASVLFGGVMVAVVYRLRFTQPDRPRLDRYGGYPVTPAAYLAILLTFLLYVVQGNPPVGNGLCAVCACRERTLCRLRL